MISTFFFRTFTGLFLLLLSMSAFAQASKPIPASNPEIKMEVIQFHSEHRCMTCNKIEVLTKETLTAYKDISFSLVNVDDPKNQKKAEQFEAAGTALFLYHPKTGRKKDLTDFAFMNAGNKDKFISGLRKELEAFLK
jgi:hypothetical protein